MIFLQDVLLDIGFRHSGHKLIYKFPGFDLSATNGMGRHYNQVFTFLGNIFTARTAEQVEFEIEEKVESYEQGLALLHYYLRNSDLGTYPDWWKKGKILQDELPWRKLWKKQQEAYDKIPKAILELQWFKLLIKELRLLVQNTYENDQCSFYFDGEILIINVSEKKIICSGTGSKWHEVVYVKAISLIDLPKRIYKNQVSQLYANEGFLHIYRNKFQIINSTIVNKNEIVV